MNKEAEIVLDLRDVWLRIPVDTRESRTVKSNNPLVTGSPKANKERYRDRGRRGLCAQSGTGSE